MGWGPGSLVERKAWEKQVVFVVELRLLEMWIESRSLFLFVFSPPLSWAQGDLNSLQYSSGTIGEFALLLSFRSIGLYLVSNTTY